MGVDCSAYVTLGVRVQRSDLLTRTGSSRRCSQGHVAEPASYGFCPKDGTRFAEVMEETPTPALVKWAKSKEWDVSSGFLWETLCEESQVGALGIHPVAAIESSERRSSGTFAFGIRMLEQDGGSRTQQSANPIDLEQLLKSTQIVKNAAAELGIKGEPKLYLTFFWSV